MKYLLVLVVVGVLVWMLMARQRSRPGRGDSADRAKPDPKTGPAPMLACAHCGVHLPLEDALNDAAGQVFCSEAHRLAGPG